MKKEGITAKDVEELCTVRVQDKIFDMVEAVADKKTRNRHWICIKTY